MNANRVKHMNALEYWVLQFVLGASIEARHRLNVPYSNTYNETQLRHASRAVLWLQAKGLP